MLMISIIDLNKLHRMIEHTMYDDIVHYEYINIQELN